MTSSENLTSIIEPLSSRSSFADSWLSEASARDTEALTKALQTSFSNNDNNPLYETLASDFIAPFISPETPTVSNVSGSDPDTLPKRHRTAVPGPNTGKIKKRKLRASKTHTTFIKADPANFRQMVQQVTGIRFGNAQLPVAPVLKPEPQRPGSGRLPGIGGWCLPTLDTSAFLLDHHQHTGPPPTSVSGVGSANLNLQTALVADDATTVSDFDARVVESHVTNLT